MQHVNSITGLKAVAITGVLLYHFDYIQFGWIGVQLFFVISGYLITKSLLLQRKPICSDRKILKNFYLRRLARILPAYLFYLFIIGVIYSKTGTPTEFGDWRIYLFTFTFNLIRYFPGWHFEPTLTHLWFVSVIVHLYLIWPLLMIQSIKRKWNLGMIMTFFIILAPLIRFALELKLQSLTYLSDIDRGEVIYHFTFSHLDAFALGAILNFVPLEKISKRLISLIPFVCFLTFLSYGYFYHLSLDPLTTASYWQSLGYPIASIGNYNHIISYSIINLFFASVLLSIIWHAKKDKWGMLNYLCSRKILVGIGTVSYGVYIYHWSLVDPINEKLLFENTIIKFLVYYSAIITLASLSFYSLESFCTEKMDRMMLRGKKK